MNSPFPQSHRSTSALVIRHPSGTEMSPEDMGVLKEKQTIKFTTRSKRESIRSIIEALWKFAAEVKM